MITSILLRLTVFLDTLAATDFDRTNDVAVVDDNNANAAGLKVSQKS